MEAKDTTCTKAHLVFGQCTSLVRTNHSSGAHCFAGVHLTHQVIGFQHPLHAQGQTQRDAHRQAFGHGHHNQRDGNHQRVEGVTRKIHPVDSSPVQVDEVHQHTQANDESGDDITRHRDAIP